MSKQTDVLRLGRWLERTVFFGVAAAMLVMGTTSVSAAGLLESVTAADVRAVAGTPVSLRRVAARSRLVRINVDELTRQVAPLGMDTAPDRVQRAEALEGVVRLELFPDVVATFRRKNVDTVGDSGYAWTGERNGPFEFASLIVENGEINGHIQLVHRLFRIEPLRGGVHRVTEIDPRRFPPDDVRPAQFPRGLGVPRRTEAPTTQPTEDVDEDIEPRAKTQIRILAAYTKAAKQESGNIVGDIKQAIALANTAFNNTNIPIKFVLAKTMAAGNYNEGAGISGFSNDLDNLNGSNGSTLSNVRNARETNLADLVSLFRKGDSSVCGIANLVDVISSATSSVAYSIMNWECISNLSFHHETGHNMSLRHDRYVDSSSGVGYNFGYVNKDSSCRIRTILAYNNDCSDDGFNCTRVNVFSTEKFVYPVGATNCKIGIKKGKANAADNTQRLKEVRGFVGGYR